MEKLNECYAEICSVSTRLTPLLEKEEAKEMEEKIRLDGESVRKVDGTVKDWVEALGEADQKSTRSGISRLSAQTANSKKDFGEKSSGRRRDESCELGMK